MSRGRKPLLSAVWLVAALTLPGPPLAVAANGDDGAAFIRVQDRPKEQCIRDLRRALVFLKLNAKTCGLDDEQIATLGRSNQVPADPRCGQPLGIHRNDTQQMSYEDCYRVYVCATRASTCSIERIQGGMNCELAVQQCMREHPVPK